MMTTEDGDRANCPVSTWPEGEMKISLTVMCCMRFFPSDHTLLLVIHEFQSLSQGKEQLDYGFSCCFPFLCVWRGGVWAWSSVGRVFTYSAQGPEFDPVLRKLGVMTPVMHQSGWGGRKNMSLKSSSAAFFCVFLIMTSNHSFNHSSLRIENTLTLIFRPMWNLWLS